MTIKVGLAVLLTLLSIVGAGWLYKNYSFVAKKELLILDMVGKNTESSFNNAKKLKKYGYNGQIKRDFIIGAITFDSLKEDIFPEGSESRKTIYETEVRVRNQINAALAAGIKIYYFTDVIILPKKIKELYRDQICDEDGNISFDKPRTKEIYKIMIEEVFRKFPEVEGLVIRTGENYVYDLPHYVGNSPIDKNHPRESHINLINFLRKEICEKRNKKIIYRTWSFDGFHTDPNYYLNVTDKIEPHPNLIFSIKHINGDFHRTNSFNPTLSLGSHQQIVEVQCQREYEGKGAHPNYIAKGVIDGFEEFNSFSKKVKRFLKLRSNSLMDIRNDKNFRGVWTWSRGGGWGGPYIKNELWCDVNAFVISTWANDTERKEEEIFNQYAADVLNLEEEDIIKFRKINILSTQGVISGQYSSEFPVNIWWTRDDFFGGTNDLEKTFEWLYDNKMINQALKEKQQSQEIWDKILKISTEITDTPHKNFILTSSKYGKIKYSIINQAWIIMLKGFHGDKTGNYDITSIKNALEKYDNYWLEFNALEKGSPYSSSIYRPYSFVIPAFNENEPLLENGMKKSVNKYRSIVGYKGI